MRHPRIIGSATMAGLTIFSVSWSQERSMPRPETGSTAALHANDDEIIARFKEVESGLQLGQIGVCHDSRRERRLREANAQVASLRKPFAQRTGRHWDYQLWIIDGTGCEGSRLFGANMATIDREIRELRALVE
jgi:hypothetical protein